MEKQCLCTCKQTTIKTSRAMEKTKKRTIEELNKELDEYFEGVVKRMKECNSTARVSVTHPCDGGVACVHIATNHWRDPVCDSVRVLVTSAFNGCFKVAIPTTELPMVETQYIMNQHFDKCEDAYTFVVGRAIDINDFFDHSK